MRKVFYGTKWSGTDSPSHPYTVLTKELSITESSDENISLYDFDIKNNSLRTAILEGFRNIDIHDHYEFNPYKIGLVLNDLYGENIGKRVLQRSDFYIQSMPCSINKEISLKECIDYLLESLQTDYLDSFFLSYEDINQQFLLDLTDIYNSGKIQSIGVTNVNIDQLLQLETKDLPKPVAIQNSFGCSFFSDIWDEEVYQYSKQHGIDYQVYGVYNMSYNVGSALHKKVFEIANRYAVKEIDVKISFIHAIGMTQVTSSSNVGHIRELLDIPKLQLTKEEVDELYKSLLNIECLIGTQAWVLSLLNDKANIFDMSDIIKQKEFNFNQISIFSLLPDSERTMSNLDKIPNTVDYDVSDIFNLLPSSERNLSIFLKIPKISYSQLKVFEMIPKEERSFVQLEKIIEKMNIDAGNDYEIRQIFEELPTEKQNMSHLLEIDLEDNYKIQYPFEESIDYARDDL
ncbi:MAG: diketogulonate reductase-like aldo/keto reductase [Candidatus Midichloriaceae bacterium]|jgi:diketogulonate reductase-like aldo/keto reductase